MKKITIKEFIEEIKNQATDLETPVTSVSLTVDADTGKSFYNIFCENDTSNNVAKGNTIKIPCFVEEPNEGDIQNATYVSIWENGMVESSCRVNMLTKEVFDIEVVEVGEDFEILEKEGIIFPDGTSYEVYPKDERPNTDSFYYV